MILMIQLVVQLLITSPVTVKHENFKTCDQSGFCRRNRQYADAATAASTSWVPPYQLDKAVNFKDGKLSGTVIKTLPGTNDKVRLPLTISFLKSGVARVSLDEERRQKKDIELRHNSQARKERYNEAANWAIVGGLEPSKNAAVKAEPNPGFTEVLYGPYRTFEAVIRHSPFGIEFKRDGETHVVFNERGFLNMEHWRPKVEREVKEGEEQPQDAVDESTWWDESFGGNTDSKPKGPESVALDITFPDYEHVYGIPEHASSLSLKETRYVSHTASPH
jgi:mannosyl-oligosaccharide alpha-1,3-glucosidase